MRPKIWALGVRIWTLTIKEILNNSKSWYYESGVRFLVTLDLWFLWGFEVTYMTVSKSQDLGLQP